MERINHNSKTGSENPLPPNVPQAETPKDYTTLLGDEGADVLRRLAELQPGENVESLGLGDAVERAADGSLVVYLDDETFETFGWSKKSD